MKDLVKHAFDFFGYIIPGLFIIFSISVLVLPIDSLNDVITLTKKFDAGLATVLVIIAYVIGFCIYPIGRHIYKTIGFKIFGNTIHEDSNQSNLSVPTKYALIREHSPINFQYVESWNIYCAMSHNLMVACLTFSIVALIKPFISGDALFWVPASLISLSLSYILMGRAVTYFHWSAYDINATINSLNLKSKN